MGGNASTGLGSADHHSSRDMRGFEADDRPTNETNRKSLFPADKSPRNVFQPLGTEVSHRKPNTEEDIRSRRRDAEEELIKTEDSEGLPKTCSLSNSPKMHGAEHLNGV